MRSFMLGGPIARRICLRSAHEIRQRGNAAAVGKHMIVNEGRRQPEVIAQRGFKERP